MASPTRAEIEGQIKQMAKIANEFRKFCGTHVAAGSSVNVGDNFVNMEDTFLQSLESNYGDLYSSALRDFRSALVLAMQRVPGMISPGIADYAKFIGYPELSTDAMIGRIYDYMMDNTLRVTSRQFTFGTPTFSGAVGNGMIHRLNLDERSQTIEAQTADTKTAECTADEHSGAREHEEIFYFAGSAAERDILKSSGSGRGGSIKALSANDSFRFISNPSFSQYSGTSITSLSAITDWTASSSVTNFEIDQTNYYRDFSGDSTPASLKFKANDKIVQNFNVKRAQFNPRAPHYLQIAWNRSIGSGDGTLTLRRGSKSTSVVLAAQSGWQILKMPIDQDLWFRNWNQEDPKIEIELSSRTTGYVLVDDVTMGQMTNFDGAWYAVVGGSTPFLRRDKATWTDTEVAFAVLQWVFWFFFNAYLPSTTGGGVTWTDPT
jgi:hypothetical protein